MNTPLISDDGTRESEGLNGIVDLDTAEVRREPVGWVMWTIAAVIAIIALLMSSIALGRSDGDTTSGSGGSGGSSGNTPTPPAAATGAKIDFQATPATDWKPS